MKKVGIKFLFLLGLYASTTTMFAQDTITHTDYVRSANNTIARKNNIKTEELILINVSGGLSLPTANFRNATSPLGGAMAKSGYFAQGSVLLKLSDNFGFNLGYLYQSNKFDEKLAEKIGTSQGLTPKIKASNWFVRGGFAGLSFFVPSKTFSKLTLCLNASTGYVQCTSPNITTTYNFPTGFGGSNTVTQEMWSTKAWSVAFLGGAGFSYKFTDYIGVHLMVNYLQTIPEFKEVTITSSMPSQPIPPAYIEQKITSLNIQAGVSFYMNRYVKDK